VTFAEARKTIAAGALRGGGQGARTSPVRA
jgi:hypothetical protein